MLKKVLLIFSIFSFFCLKAQTDTAVLNKMSPEELLQYYINEKEPEGMVKGPEKVGDSLYNILNPQVVPTKTVEGEPYFREADDIIGNKSEEDEPIETADQKQKPKISIGAGRLGFFGDIYSKHFQLPLTARPAFDLGISQRLSRYLQLNFNVMFGKLGANEFLLNRQENFQSEIRAGGLNLLYDFGNFIPDRYTVRPFVSLGITGFEFLSKTDLKDKNGNTYYYWSDGSIKNMAEGSAGAQNAIDLKRDYVYETDIRELNKDGFGKYQERAWAMPIGVGFTMKVTNRIDAKINFQYFFSSTDYIDGLTNKSIESRKGTKQRDNFTYTSVSLQYDLIAKPLPKKKKPVRDTLGDSFWLALDKLDLDKDGVPDLSDDCAGTEAGVKVNLQGCPPDDDNDGIPNYRDDELETPLGAPVNGRGVAQTDDYWAKWYAQYMNDSTGVDKEIEVIENSFALNTKATKLDVERDLFTVELIRYSGSIPSDELSFLLSIGDIKSTTLDDGTTVVYTSGEYKKIKNAVRRRDEYIGNGIKGAGVSKLKGKQIIQLTEKEIEEQIKKENELALATLSGGGNANNNGSVSGGGNNSGNNGGSNNGGNGNNTNGGNNNGNNGTNNGGNNGTNNGSNNGTNNGGNSNSNGVANNSGNNGSNNGSSNNSDANEDNMESFSKNDVVYRVQLGAFKNKISTSVFNTSAGVLELKTGESIYRYVTKGYKSIEQAASVRADLVIQGYSDAFVTAYKDGKRVMLSSTTKAVEKNYKEDLDETKMFSSVDKKLVIFKIQLSIAKTPSAIKLMEARTKDLTDTEKQSTASGGIRFTNGSFNNYDAAEKHRKDLESKGFGEAFIIATFKNEIISLQEAMELLK